MKKRRREIYESPSIVDDVFLYLNKISFFYEITKKKKMGVQYSSFNDLKSNEYLSRFVGEQSFSIDDSFWSEFLSFQHNFPFTK